MASSDAPMPDFLATLQRKYQTSESQTSSNTMRPPVPPPAYGNSDIPHLRKTRDQSKLKNGGRSEEGSGSEVTGVKRGNGEDKSEESRENEGKDNNVREDTNREGKNGTGIFFTNWKCAAAVGILLACNIYLWNVPGRQSCTTTLLPYFQTLNTTVHQLKSGARSPQTNIPWANATLAGHVVLAEKLAAGEQDFGWDMRIDVESMINDASSFWRLAKKDNNTEVAERAWAMKEAAETVLAMDGCGCEAEKGSAVVQGLKKMGEWLCWPVQSLKSRFWTL